MLAVLRERERVARVRYDGGTAWLVLHHEDLSAAFRDEISFPAEAAYRRFAEPAQGRTMQCLPAPEHRRQRELVAPWFAPRAVDELCAEVIEPIATRLVDEVTGRGEVDLVAALARPLPFEELA